MEDVLDAYHREYDPAHPLVCMDESPKQLIADVRPALPMEPGKPERIDEHYQRNGSRNLFVACEPLRGWRHLKVTQRRTKIDWAHFIRELVDVHYPDAERIVLVMDNLNTHRPASLYEAFEPAEAKRIWDRLEIHYTPKHGSWLNMAEIELGILSRQCLKKRIPDQQSMRKEVEAWERNRNNMKLKVDWQFSTKDARIKLKKLYPSF